MSIQSSPIPYCFNKEFLHHYFGQFIDQELPLLNTMEMAHYECASSLLICSKYSFWHQHWQNHEALSPSFKILLWLLSYSYCLFRSLWSMERMGILDCYVCNLNEAFDSSSAFLLDHSLKFANQKGELYAFFCHYNFYPKSHY